MWWGVRESVREINRRGWGFVGRQCSRRRAGARHKVLYTDVLFDVDGTETSAFAAAAVAAFAFAAAAMLLLLRVPRVLSGDVMPSGHEGEMYAGGVRIVVHPVIDAAGKDADKGGAAKYP